MLTRVNVKKECLLSPLSFSDRQRDETTMCKTKDRHYKLVKAGNNHEESGGFHLVELNSPINIGSGTTIFLFALALLALGFWAYQRDKRSEKRREAKEAKEKEDQDERRLRKAKVQRDIERLENETLRRSIRRQPGSPHPPPGPIL